MTTFTTHAAALATLEAHGFRPSTIGTNLYVGPRGMSSGMEPIPTVAIAEIKRHAVAPEWGGGEFFMIKFH